MSVMWMVKSMQDRYLPEHLVRVHERSYPTDLGTENMSSLKKPIAIINVGQSLTCDEVHGNEDGTQSRELRQHIVDLVVGICHLDRDLG